MGHRLRRLTCTFEPLEAGKPKIDRTPETRSLSQMLDYPRYVGKRRVIQSQPITPPFAVTRE